MHHSSRNTRHIMATPDTRRESIEVNKEATYLGVTVSTKGFRKKAGSHLEETKCRAACSEITSQQFFDAELPISTITALYRTNVRSIMLYGAPFLSSVSELEKLDLKMVHQYIKRIVHEKQDIPQKLIDRICIRIRLPSLTM